MIKLTQRQQIILEFIRRKIAVGNKEIAGHLSEKKVEKISRVTIIRDLEALLKNKLITKKGRGRNVFYQVAEKNPLLAFFDQEKYFTQNPDERNVLKKSFNFNIFKNFSGIISALEAEEFFGLNKQYQVRLKKISPAILKKEFERLVIELSWKSSQIEGNTYSLLDTEILIKENKEAAGHKKEEALMILNHKKALDYIIFNKKIFRKITLRQIENIHRLLVDGLGVNFGLRKGLVGITGTAYRPLDNQQQIREAMENAVKTANKIKNPLEKALAISLLIAYIQPFEDGNKRTSRLAANALLLAYDFCPLSFRSINEVDYKKAVILFYEQNSALFFKELFLKQFRFSVDNYFK